MLKSPADLLSRNTTSKNEIALAFLFRHIYDELMEERTPYERITDLERQMIKMTDVVAMVTHSHLALKNQHFRTLQILKERMDLKKTFYQDILPYPQNDK